MKGALPLIGVLLASCASRAPVPQDTPALAFARTLPSPTLCYVRQAGDGNDWAVTGAVLRDRGYTCQDADREAGKVHWEELRTGLPHAVPLPSTAFRADPQGQATPAQLRAFAESLASPTLCYVATNGIQSDLEVVAPILAARQYECTPQSIALGKVSWESLTGQNKPSQSASQARNILGRILDGAAAYATGVAIGESMRPRPPQPAIQTYNINGKIITCTTMGTVTNCR